MGYKHMCLECEAANMVKKTKDVVVGHGHFSEVVPKVFGWHCPNCDNIEFLGDGDGQRVATAMDGVFAQERAAQGQFIRGARRKLHLTQQQAAMIFGGGSSSFSEYEHGKTQPPKATVALLRLLSDHPELLPEVLAASV